MENTPYPKISNFLNGLQNDIEKEKYTESALIEKWASRLLKTYQETTSNGVVLSTKDLFNETLLALSNPINGKEIVHISFTGFKELDKMLGGLPLGELVVVGGRPGMGKTSFLITILANCLNNKIPSIYFTLDYNSTKIMNGLMSNLSEVSISKICNRELSENEISLITERTIFLKDSNLIINDVIQSIDDILLNTEIAIKENKIKVVIIDYLQLIQYRSKRELYREAEIAKLCRELKQMAKLNNIAVIVSSQLSRANETRGGDKRPQLSDLRESGAIEQDADKVLFIHRPEYYGITEDAEGNCTKGRGEIIIAKNRMGIPGSSNLNFMGQYHKFKERIPFEETKDFASDISRLRKDKFND